MRPGTGKLTIPMQMLHIYIEELDEWEGEPLYHAIVVRMRELGIAGCTVFRGIEGYGSHRRIHREKLLSFTNIMPILITLADSADKIQQALPILDQMIGSGLILKTDAQVIKYSSSVDTGSDFLGG